MIDGEMVFKVFFLSNFLQEDNNTNQEFTQIENTYFKNVSSREAPDSVGKAAEWMTAS